MPIGDARLGRIYQEGIDFTGESSDDPVNDPWGGKAHISLHRGAGVNSKAGGHIVLHHLISDTIQVAGMGFNVYQAIEHKFGGQNGAGVLSTRGGRHALQVHITQVGQTDPANTNRNYGAGQFEVIAGWDGGVVGDYKGGYFALNPVAHAKAGATFLHGLYGAEVNTIAETGSSMMHKVGWAVTSHYLDKVHGDITDAGYALSAQMGSNRYKVGILFSNYCTEHPITVDGTLIKTVGDSTVLHALDVSSYTVTGALVKGKHAELREDGFYLDGVKQVLSIPMSPAIGNVSVNTSVGAWLDKINLMLEAMRTIGAIAE